MIRPPRTLAQMGKQLDRMVEDFDRERASLPASRKFQIINPDGSRMSPDDIRAALLAEASESKLAQNYIAPARGPRQYRAASGDLYDYIKRAWAAIEPSTVFKPNWHIEAMCEHLEAVTRGEIRDLVINVPPGFMKSLTTCVFWPTWMWAKDPSLKLVFASYSNEFSVRDATKALALVQSDFYRASVPGFSLKGTRPKITDQRTMEDGFRVSLGVGGSLSGRRADIIVVDDPLKLDEANSEAARRAVIDWWNLTAGTRGGVRGLRRVVIMQRLHEADLAGVFLEQGAEHLVIPMEWGGTRRRSTWAGWSGDPRTEPGELAWPEFQPADATRGTSAVEETVAFVAKQKVALGSALYSAAYSQDPEPASGLVWKREWFKRFEREPSTFSMLSTSWDMTFKGHDQNDYVVGLVIGRVQGDYYVLHEERGHWDFTETLAAVRRVAAMYPTAGAHYVEDTANGPAIISSLRKEISGIIAVKPDGDKVSRAHAVAPMLEAGNVHLPAAREWAEDFIAECTKFPNGKNDDRVDALSQGLNRMRKGFVW